MNNRIKKLRQALKMTQDEFASHIGVKRNTVSIYESGRNTPMPSVINLICKEFNVNKEWLLHGTGEMFLNRNEDTLDKLARDNNLSLFDYLLLEKYITLSKADRDAVIRYIRQVGSAFSNIGDEGVLPYLHKNETGSVSSFALDTSNDVGSSKSSDVLIGAGASDRPGLPIEASSDKDHSSEASDPSGIVAAASCGTVPAVPSAIQTGNVPAAPDVLQIGASLTDSRSPSQVSTSGVSEGAGAKTAADTPGITNVTETADVHTVGRPSADSSRSLRAEAFPDNATVYKLSETMPSLAADKPYSSQSFGRSDHDIDSCIARDVYIPDNRKDDGRAEKEGTDPSK